MSSIVSGVGDLIGSILEIFKGIFDTIFAAVSSVFSLVAGLLSNFVELFEGIVGFVLANFLLLGTIAGAFVAYAIYRAKQNRPITVGDKKLQ